MKQNDTLHLAREFLDRMGNGAEPAEIANLFSENMEWEIAGDIGVLPWIGKQSGRTAVTDFVRDSRAMIDRISFEVHDVLAGDHRAVILGSLASKLKRTARLSRRTSRSCSPSPMVKLSAFRCWKIASLSLKRRAADHGYNSYFGRRTPSVHRPIFNYAASDNHLSMLSIHIPLRALIGIVARSRQSSDSLVVHSADQ